MRLTVCRHWTPEAAYVELFDRGRATSLHLFEHVHGDSRDRGPAMIDLARRYEQKACIWHRAKCPITCQRCFRVRLNAAPDVAREFLAEMTHILQNDLQCAECQTSKSPYASVLGALIELSGGRAEAVDVAADPALDETWEEPLAFGGCSTNGQSRPGCARSQCSSSEITILRQRVLPGASA